MRRTRILLYLFSFLSVMIVVACKKKEEPPEPEMSPAERARMEKRYLDSVDSINRYYQKLEEEGRRRQDSLARAYDKEEREAKKHGRGSSYSGGYDDDEGADERARRKREEELNRAYDRGFYDENVKGWNEDTYDPDIDDW